MISDEMKNWEYKSLKDISKKIFVGIATSTTEHYVENGVVLIRNQNIKEGYIDSGELLNISSEFDEDNKNKRLISGDIITVRTGYPGLSAVVEKELEGSQTFTTLVTRLNEGVNPYFITQYINSEYGIEEVKRLQFGGAQQNLNAKSMEKIKCPVPPLREQQKIAEILSTWDLAIEKQEHLIEKKKEFKKGLMQRLLSGEVRFKEFKDEWKVVNLGTVFERATQKNNTGCNNVLTISAQNGLVNQEEYFNKLVSSKDLSGYYLLSKGDFAYNKSYSNGYPLGAIKRLNNYEEGVVSPLYICFRAKENISTCFYEQYFESGALNKEIMKIAQEGARNHGLLNISVTEFFKDIKIVRPTIEEQNKIAEVLLAADKEIDLLQKELEVLKLQKKGLMQRLLTGEVRVKV